MLVWEGTYDAYAGLGQSAGNLSTEYGREQMAQMLQRLGPLLQRLLNDPCFREMARRRLGAEFDGWLARLQTAEGASDALTSLANELLMTAGTMGLSKIKWLDELEDLARLIDRVTPDARAAKTEASLVRGWKVGDPINNLTSAGNVPSWSAVRQRFWKNEALNNPGTYDVNALSRMQRGLAPQQINPNTGRLESMTLHHSPAQRNGGLFDVKPLWPDDHAAVDAFYHTGN